MSARMAPDDRREALITAAVAYAIRHGWAALTRERVAEEAGCSPSLVTHYYLTFDGLRDDVMELAVAGRHLGIVAEGLAARHPMALGAPLCIREAAAAALVRE